MSTDSSHKVAFDIKDPVMLLAIYDEAIRTGLIKLYPWQVEIHLRFANIFPGSTNRISVRANNGSGKSTYLMAPCAIWLAMRYYESSIVITSASGAQLDRQTGRAVKSLCDAINAFHGEKIWETKYREYTNTKTGSVIQLFATDEANKAEGYHPITPKGLFALLVDEAKSITQDIYEALSRCNGQTHRMDISSPGAPTGHFYRTQLSDKWWHRHVTWKDTPHITQEEYEEAVDQYGENSPVVRSSFWAEFTSIDNTTVLTYEDITRLINNPPEQYELGHGRFAGLDLSLGGDEAVLSVFEENRHIGLEVFRFANSLDNARHIKTLFRKWKLNAKNINADDGGVGRTVIDILWEDGYRVNRVLNQAAAYNKQAYANRGAEIYANFARYVEELDIILLNDKTLLNQLANRYYDTREGGKMFLESKQKAKAKGHPSPDRADATTLAFANKPYGAWKRKNIISKKKSSRGKPTISIPSTEELVEIFYDKQVNPRASVYIDRYGSLIQQLAARSKASLIPTSSNLFKQGRLK